MEGPRRTRTFLLVSLQLPLESLLRLQLVQHSFQRVNIVPDLIDMLFHWVCAIKKVIKKELILGENK